MPSDEYRELGRHDVNGPFPKSLKSLLIVAIAILALASCKKGTNPPTEPPPGPTPVASASVTATTANTFSPATVDLIVGGEVTFTNAGGRHNVNASFFRCGSDGCNGPAGPSESLWTFTITFPNVGTVGYVCDEHAGVGMTGQIIVH
jgi:plastocyanin